MRAAQKKWRMSELKFLKQNFHLPDKTLAIYFNTSVGAVRTFRRANGFIKSEKVFKKGNKPWNKGKEYNAGGRSIETRFVKGRKRNNERPLYEVFKYRDGLFIKLPNHRQYSYKRYVYEKKTDQKLSKGDVIRLKDKNIWNCEFSNLEKITRRKNLELNINRKKQAQTVAKLRAEKRNILKEFLITYGIGLKKTA